MNEYLITACNNFVIKLS